MFCMFGIHKLYFNYNFYIECSYRNSFPARYIYQASVEFCFKNYHSKEKNYILFYGSEIYFTKNIEINDRIQLGQINDFSKFDYSNELTKKIKNKLEEILVGSQKFIHPSIYLDYLSVCSNDQILNYFKNIDKFKFDELENKIKIVENKNLQLEEEINNIKLEILRKEEESTNLIIKQDKTISELKDNLRVNEENYNNQNQQLNNINKEEIIKNQINYEKIIKNLKKKIERIQDELVNKDIQLTKITNKFDDLQELYEKLKNTKI